MANIPIVGAAVGTVGSIVGQHMANKANQKLQQKQLDWNEEMWHQQNAYNTPAAQMQRYADAGLNPNLVVGNTPGGNAGSPAEGVAPSQVDNVMEGFDPIGNYIALKNASEDIENKRTERELKIDKTEAEINVLRAQAEGKGQENKWGREDRPYNAALKRGEVNLQGIQLLSGKLGLAGQTTENQIKILQRDAATIKLAYADFAEQMNLINSYEQVKNLQARTNMTNYELDFIKNNGYRIPNKMISGLFSKILGLEGGGR